MADAAQSLPEIAGYQILGMIGAGATSVVYRGLRDRRDVAIKVMRQTEASKAADATGLLFRQEAAALARIDHPGVVKVIEAGEENGTKFLVMEMVEGESLAAMLSSSMPEDAILKLAKSLAGGLAEVHRCGLVHRDVKPSNILVQPNGEPKIIDFGFVTRMQEAANPTKDAVVGTFLYGAPEQTGMLNRTVDGRSDLYSLGCVLFECATGKPPFTANDVTELLRLHSAVAAPRVHDLRPEIRPLVSEIIGKLLSKDPDDRYQTALGLHWDLEHLADIEAARTSSAPLSLGSKDAQFRLVPEIPFVGRVSEMASVKRAWERASKGFGGIVQVEGEGGSGKTRLIRELLQIARGTQALVLAGKAQKSERTPFGPLREAIEEHVARARRGAPAEWEAERKKLLQAAGEVPGIVKRLSKSLEASFGPVPDIPPLEPDAEQERFYEQVAEFLANLSRAHGAAVLQIDDVQWLDDGTVKILKQLALRLEVTPMLLATTARNDADSEPARERFVKEMRGKVERLVLEPLDLEAVDELVTAHLGGKLEASVLEKLASRANGNPFAIGQYVRALLDQGLLRPTPAGWQVDSQQLNQVVLGNDVVQLLLNRTAFLGPEAQRVLGAAAILGFGFEQDLLVQMLGKGETLVRRGLDEALRGNLIEQGETNRYLFVHDRVQEALLQKLDDAQKKDLSQAAAEAVEALHGATPADAMLFAIARHYAAGHAESHQKRVFETSMAAGVNALENYANEEAFQLLDRALTASANVPELDRATLARLRELTGVASSRTGRLKLALEHFHKTLGEVHTDFERAHLRYMIALVHSAEGHNDPAWGEVQEALGLIGARMPESRAMQLFSALYYWVNTAIRFRTGWGFGKARGEERKRREMVSQILNTAYFVAYYVGDQFRVAMTSFLRLHNSHFLGPTAENGKSLAAHGLFVANMFGDKKGAERLGNRGVAICQQLGDNEAIAFCETMKGFAMDYAGATLRGQEIVRNALADAVKYCIARDAGRIVGAAGVTITHRGRARESIDAMQQHIPILKRMGANYYVSNALGALYVQHVILGRSREGLAFRAEQVQIALDMPNIRFVQSFLHLHSIHALYEQEDFTRELEDAIQKFLALRFDHYLNRLGYLMIAYVRLEQFLRTQGKRERRAARRVLLKALRTATYGPPLRCVLSPVHRCHVYVIRAAIAREAGRYRKAMRLLARAEDDASESDSPWGLWAVHRERARVAACRRDDLRVRQEAQSALEIAVTEGWGPRANKIRFEFGLEQEKLAGAKDTLSASIGPYSYIGRSFMRGGSTFLGGRSQAHGGSTYLGGAGTGSTFLGGQSIAGTMGTATVTRSDFSAQRYFEALLEVSLAASTSTDSDVQSRAALDALIRTLGAERGFLFLAGEDGELALAAGRTVEGKDEMPLQGYSSTVVRKVHAERKPLVVTGTDEGEALGSASAVSFDLRSIMAAPLTVRDKAVGVIYVDSRLMKGLFTPEHLAILQAIGNQMAIALETARGARLQATLESERSKLERDLELTKAVQALCLPRADVWDGKRFSVGGFYRPASRCGGDWWWHEQPTADSIGVLLGDVTGHGAASAMVSASAASCYRLLRRTSDGTPTTDLLEPLSGALRDITAGEFMMTMSALSVDADGKLRWVNAGGPPIFVLRPDKVDVLSSPGTPLGSDQFSLGKCEAVLQPGDRVFLFTDGLLELTPPGYHGPLSMRKLFELFSKTRGLELSKAMVWFAERLGPLEMINPDGTERDDVTFVMVDYKLPEE
jgi:serine phosphatase RsbU (regulator of sigma subunit)